MFDPYALGASEGFLVTRRWGIPEVEPEWVAAHRRGLRLVDVREPYELLEGRVEAAENLPLGDLGRAVGAWDPDAPLVLLCRSGSRSAQAAVALERAGFSRVASVRGGILAWLARGVPTRLEGP